MAGSLGAVAGLKDAAFFVAVQHETVKCLRGNPCQTRTRAFAHSSLPPVGVPVRFARIVGLVPGAGIEPARLAAGDFESPASTNFTTRAGSGSKPEIMAQ